MAKTWDNEINKNTDWGGDSSTDNLPVSGRRIQEFIKNQLQSKAGVFYYDTANNRYMIFADEESRDKYLENPQDNSDLLMGFFDAPFNYSAEINLISERFVPILTGTTGNVIEFTFDTLNKSGQSVGEDVVCTYTFVRGSVRKTVTQKYRVGTTVRFNIDEYIETGTNNVTIGIIGQNTLAATTVGVTYQVVDLTLTDSFDISKMHDLSEVNQIEVPFSISGYGAKIMEWYVDGELIPYVKSEDEITEAATSRTKYISIEGFSQGAHSVQFRAYTVINGEKFYSKTLYREFIVYNRSNKDSIIAVGTEFPLGVEIVGANESLTLQGLSQYLPYVLKLGLFNPTYATTTPLEVYLDGELLTTLSMQNGKEVGYELAITTYGDKVLKLKSDLVERNIPLSIDKSSTSIEEITQGLSLALSATGKSNSASDRNTWKYGSYSTLFNGFKWLANSGWNNGELVISGGASININCAPLSGDILTSGKTLEFEFSTRNVTDIDTVICDLRNDNGTGLLITASEASITSAGGSKVSTRYKSGENVRLSFVVNKKSGVADKGLVFLYVNGILSAASNYAANDNFIAAKTITIASSEDADIAVRSLRFYDTALTANQILNNYMLYRSSAEELLKAYNRNNIYEEGTTDFSIDILSGQLPMMIITGDIPALEATTDKNLQIDVDVEYINLQDQSRSFKLKNGAMRPQGTSSMSYPKKNFRLYTNKKDSTVLYNADGGVVADKKYAFKEGAQPVTCWCFKADYAESSGTHNTGIARLWNDVMKNAQVEGEYKCRTKAQQTAIDNGYSYDVRTTIDGFPILMFYRLTENDPLVFIGKYNFNNDKSTESVFGFRDIPGFDNSKVECWEVLNNGHHLALFQNTTNWDTEWSDAFEARYPDGSTNIAALKEFAEWLVFVKGLSNGIERFSQEKYEHLDVYKMAAYYVYLMRFGAVDQVVKNAMFTTEDGAHWYYINYDNDTINGLRNDGLLIYPPTIDRQTLDPTISGVYAYAGHDSALWNMLEGDTDFMQIVSEVDSALYSAGLSYANVIKMFDTEQSGKWCERIYNQDAQYKYIGPFNDHGINNLFMLQGSRQSHQRRWLSERFSLLDAKFVSGEYKANSFEVKLAGAPIGLEFGIKAGVKTNYGYGVNNVPIQYGIELAKGGEHTFSTTSVLNVGDPLRIYAAPYLEEIDITAFAPYLTQISIANVYSDRLGTKLKKLILGGEESENTALTELSGINQAVALESLQCSGFKGLKTLDLTRNTLLKALYAQDSGLTSVTLPTGAPLDTLYLPASLQALTLNGLFSLTNAGLQMQNNGCNLTTIEVTDCPQLDTQALVENWIDYKVSEDSLCSLTVNDIEWKGVDVEWILSRLGNLRNLSLKGVIEVTEVTEEQLTSLQQMFGKNCFSANSELYIKVPADAAMYFIGPDSVRALTTAQYEVVVTTASAGETTLSIEFPSSVSTSERNKVTLQDGFLTVGDIDSNATITIAAKFIPDEGLAIVKRKTVALQKINYPASGTIAGAGEVTKKGVQSYNLTVGTHDEDAQFYVEWKLSGDAMSNNYATLGTSDDGTASVIVSAIEESSATLTAKIYRSSDSKLLATATKAIQILVGDIIMTATSNPKIMQICYQKGWAAHSNYMTAAEAAMVTNIDGAFETSTLKGVSFNEFVHFINTTPFKISYFSEITIPWSEFGDIDYEYANLRIGVTKQHWPNLVRINNTQKYLQINADEVDMPALKEIKGCLDVEAKGSFSLPSLKKLSGSLYINCDDVDLSSLETYEYIGYHVYAGGCGITIDCENVMLPSLSNLVLPDGITTDLRYYPSIINGSQKIKKISVPKLKIVPYWAYFLSGTFSNLTQIEAPLLEVIRTGSATLNSIETLNLPSLKYWESCINGITSTSLTTINVPNIEKIGDYVQGKVLANLFDKCSALTEIVGLKNIKVICGSSIFPSQFSLGESVVMPNLNILACGIFSKYGSTSKTGLLSDKLDMKSFSAPNLITLLDRFENNELLESVNLPSLTTVYSYRTFKGCSSLTEVVIPYTAKTQNDMRETFEGCASLTKAIMGFSESGHYDSNTFNGCTSLEVLEISTNSLKIWSGLTKLHELRIRRNIHPSLSVDGDILLIGSEVEESIPKTLHVLESATGYNTSEWNSLINNAGFTLVKDLTVPS